VYESQGPLTIAIIHGIEQVIRKMHVVELCLNALLSSVVVLCRSWRRFEGCTGEWKLDPNRHVNAGKLLNIKRRYGYEQCSLNQRRINDGRGLSMMNCPIHKDFLEPYHIWKHLVIFIETRYHCSSHSEVIRVIYLHLVILSYQSL
jgi:hypothetical protein